MAVGRGAVGALSYVDECVYCASSEFAMGSCEVLVNVCLSELRESGDLGGMRDICVRDM